MHIAGTQARQRPATDTLPMTPLARAIACLVIWGPGLAAAAGTEDEVLGNHFNDPFMQVTAAIIDCPKQEGPRITLAQMRAESHWRAERGTSCFRSGRCRLPNAYLYDREIIPRVKQAIEVDGRFANTSLWLEGQRRWVWLKGCVASADQSTEIERLVRNIDDVEAVINQLTVLAR